jgi:hypothetical protein
LGQVVSAKAVLASRGTDITTMAIEALARDKRSSLTVRKGQHAAITTGIVAGTGNTPKACPSR